MGRRLILTVIGITLLGSACIDDLEPDVGPPLRAVCSNVDSDPETNVSFAGDIAPMFDGCLDCHAPNAPTPLGFEVGGLDMSSYSTLRAGGAISGSDVIIDGQPCQSVLVQKVGPAAPFGGRMPLNGPPFLSELQRQLIHDWIAEGARDN
jgi:hypothetical protein